MASFDNAIKSTRRKRLAGLPIAISCLMGAGALAGSGVGIWHIAQNYQESAEFSKSVNGRIEVDPLAYNPEATDDDIELATDNLKEAASRLSSWLKSQGQEKYDVAWEIYKDEDRPVGDQIYGFLNAKFNIDKIESKLESDEDDKKIDNDPYLSFFEESAFNTNNKTLVYRWYIPEAEDYDPRFTIINLQDVVEIPKTRGQEGAQTKVLTNSDGQWGAMYHIVDEEGKLNVIYNDMLTAYDYTQEEDPSNTKTIPDWKKPRLYIINNLEGMINEANYHLLNYRYNADNQGWQHDYVWYERIYKDTDYETFAKSYINDNDDRDLPPTQGRKYSAGLQKADVITDIFDPSQPCEPTPNLNILRWIDFTPGTVKYSFMNKYVEDIIGIDNKQWQDYFPKKITDTYKNEVAETHEDPREITTKLSYFWHKYNDSNSANRYLNRLISYRLPLKIQAITFNEESSQEHLRDLIDTNFQKLTTEYQSTIIKPTFIDSIFGGNSLVGWLSLGFLVFLLALLIILACLYRTTGIISWISLMFMLSMSLLLAGLATTTISMSFLFGMFGLSILGFMAALGICNRMRRRLNSNEEPLVILSKTFKKSLMPTVDISVATLIFGICFTYIAPISLNILGLILIIGAFAIFLIMYLFNAAMHLLFFNNSININKLNLFGKKTNDANIAISQGNHLVPSSLDATKLELDYYSSMSRKNIKMFSKETLILLIVLIGILVTGMVLFGVFGFANSKLFHSNACIAIYYDDTLLSQQWFIDSGFTFTSYTFYAPTEGTVGWWYFYTDSINMVAINKLIAEGHLVAGDTICYQTIFGSTNQDALIFAMVSILVASVLMSIYGAIRFNWASFVPLLIGTIAIPLLMLSISAICQIKYDETVILGVIFASILNNALVMNLMATIQDSWSRKDAYNKEEFQYIIATAIKNNWTYLWSLGLGLIIFLICFSITAPFGAIYLIILIAIGIGVSMFAAPITIGYLEYYFLLIRNNILWSRAEAAKGKVVVNYDAIDEQDIEGINKFVKVKAIPKATKLTEQTKETNNGQ